MKPRTLFNAFAIAQISTPVAQPVQVRFDPVPSNDMTLLNALRNSATDRDQIIQRRIGMITEETNPL